MPDAAMLSHRFTRRRTLLAAGGALTATLLTRGARTVAQDAPLKVVATFSILADWAANVGGEHVALATIVPAGGDAHTFDPDPQQVASIADADVIFAIGPAFEPWLADMIDASGSGATHIEVTSGMTLLGSDEEHEHEEERDQEHDHEDAHNHGDTDPHIWGDVANAIAAVESIRTALAEADSAHADAFAANASAYTGQLGELDASIREQVRTIPEEHRKLVTSHDTFAYYAHAYDFEILGTALGSLSTEAGDPSAADIATLVEAIDEAGVPAIFAENVVNPDLMQAIADEAGVELAPTLYTDALGEPGSEGDTYVKMMTYNTATIVGALAG